MSNLFTFNDLLLIGSYIAGPKDIAVDEVVIDSRKACAKSLFIPLKGEVTDGNLYIKSALENGCKASFVDEQFYKENSKELTEKAIESGATLFTVKDGLNSLQSLAKYHIKRFPDLKVISITGSSGKTTTKEILGSIVSSFKETLVTQGNYNSETGLPLTVFRINKKHKYAVLEMGMSRPGEIKSLVDIVDPDVSVITNIGTAHIGFFDSRDGIAEEKKSAFANFSGNNTGVIPGWDDYSVFLQNDVNGNVVVVNKEPNYITDIIDCGFEGWNFKYNSKDVHFSYMGKYNLLNAFLAIECAREIGISDTSIIKGLENLPSMFGRGEVLKGRSTIIRDCYNANPYSTISSLELLKNTRWDGKKVPILGSMLELGDSSLSEHKKIAAYAVEHFKTVILYGLEYKEVFASLEKKSGIFFANNLERLKDITAENIKPGTLVLLKASRGVKLEDITESLI